MKTSSPDELIDLENIDFGAVRMTNTAQSQSVVLSGANVSSISVGDEVVVSFALLPEDVVDLKSNLALATDLVVGVIRDVASNTLTTPLVVTAVSISPDTTPPKFKVFTLNLQSNTLSLTFDDVVNPTTFDATGITLRSRAARNPAQFSALTTASTTNSSVGYATSIPTLNRSGRTRTLEL